MSQNEGGSSITWTQATSGTISWSDASGGTIDWVAPDEWILRWGVWNDNGIWVDSEIWYDSEIYNDIAAGDRSVA